MATIFTIDYDQQSKWPVLINIREGNTTIFISALEHDACLLAMVLAIDTQLQESVNLYPEQGGLCIFQWSSNLGQKISHITLTYGNLQINLTESEAHQLCIDIRAILSAKFTAESKNVVDATSDLLAGAKRRMDDNLRGIFA